MFVFLGLILLAVCAHYIIGRLMKGSYKAGLMTATMYYRPEYFDKDDVTRAKKVIEGFDVPIL